MGFGTQEGLVVPVLNRAMIIVLQLLAMRVMKRRAVVRAEV